MPAAEKVAKAAPTEADLAREVIATYPKISWASPASWIGFSKDFSKIKRSLLYMCHAQVSSAENRAYDTIITAFYGLVPSQIAWFDFLQQRLFRDFKDRIELVDSGIAVKLEDIPPEAGSGSHMPKYTADEIAGKNWKYIKISKLDTIPANVVYDLCIASRVISEYQTQHATWWSMVQLGVDPGLAYRLCYSVAMSDRGRGDYLGRNSGAVKKFETLEEIRAFQLNSFVAGNAHWAYDLDASFERIIKGDYDTNKLAKLSYKEHPGSSRPCNVLWGNEGRGLQKYEGKTIGELMDTFAPVVAQALSETRPLFYCGKLTDAKPEKKGKAAAVEAAALIQPVPFPEWANPMHALDDDDIDEDDVIDDFHDFDEQFDDEVDDL